MINNQNRELKTLVEYCLDNFETNFDIHLRLHHESRSDNIALFFDTHPNFNWRIYLDDFKIYPNPLKLIYLASLVNVTITKNDLPDQIQSTLTALNINENDRLKGTFDAAGYHVGSFDIDLADISPKIVPGANSFAIKWLSTVTETPPSRSI